MSVSSIERSRDWRKYNESLVKRGELYLTLSFLENWDRDLEQINRGKLGRKFDSPFAGCIYLQGVAKAVPAIQQSSPSG